MSGFYLVRYSPDRNVRGMRSLIWELSNLYNLFPDKFKKTSGDQILFLISMKPPANWFLKSGIIQPAGFKVARFFFFFFW